MEQIFSHTGERIELLCCGSVYGNEEIRKARSLCAVEVL